MIEDGAKKRGIGRGRRSPELISRRIAEGRAVIATTPDGNLIGFSYVETYENNAFVVNSGLIVKESWRGHRVGKEIKYKVFELGRELFPAAKVFGITTSAAVMKMNTDLGYKPVAYSQIPQSEEFWKGCNTCPFVDILNRTQRKVCLCTAMLYE
jgi:hypothetical protein